MGKPRLIEQREKVTLHIPQHIMGKLRLELFSEIEGRVPHGKLSETVTDAVKDWLANRGIEP